MSTGVAWAAPVDLRALPEISQAELDKAMHALSGAGAPIQLNQRELAETASSGTQKTVTLASDILFDYNAATVRPTASAKVGELIKPLPQGVTVAVTGYTDSTGEDAYNLKLSKQRADAVAAILRKARPDLKLTVEGKGEANPVADNGTPEKDNPEGRAKNRRVELRYR